MTYDDLKYEIRRDDLAYDPWGTALAWQFAVAEVLEFERNGAVPTNWDYSPGMAIEVTDDDRASVLRCTDTATLIRLGNTLARLVRAAEHGGKSY